MKKIIIPSIIDTYGLIKFWDFDCGSPSTDNSNKILHNCYPSFIHQQQQCLQKKRVAAPVLKKMVKILGLFKKADSFNLIKGYPFNWFV